MPDTVPVMIEIERALAATLDDPGARARLERLVRRTLQSAQNDILCAGHVGCEKS